jgi:hypothetical protein
VGITAYILFLIAGVAFGYAAPTRWKWLPVLFPLVLAIGAALIHGIDAALIIRLIVALILTAAGIFLGMMIDARGERREENPRYA